MENIISQRAFRQILRDHGENVNIIFIERGEEG